MPKEGGLAKTPKKRTEDVAEDMVRHTGPSNKESRVSVSAKEVSGKKIRENAVPQIY
jgi:hypothetical protein